MSVILPVDLRVKTTLSNDDLMQNFEAIAALLAGGLTSLNLNTFLPIPLSALAGPILLEQYWTMISTTNATTTTFFIGFDTTSHSGFISSCNAVAPSNPGVTTVTFSSSPDGITYTTFFTDTPSVVASGSFYSILGTGGHTIPANTLFVKIVYGTTNAVTLNVTLQGLVGLT